MVVEWQRKLYQVLLLHKSNYLSCKYHGKGPNAPDTFVLWYRGPFPNQSKKNATTVVSHIVFLILIAHKIGKKLTFILIYGSNKVVPRIAGEPLIVFRMK